MFSKANAKLKALADVPSLDVYHHGKQSKIYSFDLLSGWSCPFAEECLSKVVVKDGKRTIQDGSKTRFRCFSASQEVLYTAAYNKRSSNFESLRGKSAKEMYSMIVDAMPKNAGLVRLHVAGDFFSPQYFQAWVQVARDHKDILFYAYTKSLPYWVKMRKEIPWNLVLTASRGGRCDHMIDEHGLRESVVVYSEQEAEQMGYEIDHDDSHACIPEEREQSFALLIHGVQPKGSEAAQAIKELKRSGVKFSYNRKGV